MNIPITRKLVATNILALSSGTGLAQFINAIALFLTARALGKESFGMYAACFALTKMTAVGFNLGLDVWLLKEGRGGSAPLGQLMGSSLAIKSALGVIWLVVILGLSLVLDPAIYPVSLLAAAAFATWLEAMLTTTLTGFTVALQNQISAVITSLSSVLLLAVTLGLMMNAQTQPVIYAQARLGISLGIAFFSLLWFWRKFHLDASLKTGRMALSAIIPYTLSEALVVVYTQADITIVAMTLGKAAAGLYSPASSIMRALFFVPQAIHVVMVPVISQLLSEKSTQLKIAFKQLNLVMLGIGAILWLVTALLGPPLVWLILGSEFSGSTQLLQILSPILLIKAGSLGMAALIVAANYQKYRVVVQALSAGLNLILNLVVVQHWGLTGVAWVYVFSELVLLAGYTYLVRSWWIRNQSLVPGAPAAR